MWKKIIINGVETCYSVSSEGEVRNDETGRILKGTYTTNEYHSVQLSIDKKARSFMVHRLVAEAFCENPNNYNIVDHIDRNKHNDSADNLRWVDARTNSLNYEKVQRDFKRTYFQGDFDQETWRPALENPNYMVSRNGSVVNKKNRNYLAENDRHGYKRINLSNGTRSLHILVWEAFNGQKVPKGMQIDHIDGDKSNNSLDNLRLVTPSENMKNAYNNGHFGQKKVLQYSLDGELIASFDTIQAASEAVGVTPAAVRSAMERKGTCKSCYWLPENEDIKKIIYAWVPKGFKVLKNHPTYCINKEGKVYNKRNKAFAPEKFWADGVTRSVILNGRRYKIEDLIHENFP